MDKVLTTVYSPDRILPPSEVLDEYLSSLRITQAGLAKRTSIAIQTINAIMQNKASITPAIAIQLEHVLGRPAHFWNNLECQYQEDLMRAMLLATGSIYPWR